MLKCTGVPLVTSEDFARFRSAVSAIDPSIWSEGLVRPSLDHRLDLGPAGAALM